MPRELLGIVDPRGKGGAQTSSGQAYSKKLQLLTAALLYITVYVFDPSTPAGMHILSWSLPFT
jgi:hypothetical protein